MMILTLLFCFVYGTNSMYFNGALVGGAGVNRLRAKEDSKVATQIVFQCEDVPGTTDVTCKKKIFQINVRRSPRTCRQPI